MSSDGLCIQIHVVVDSRSNCSSLWDKFAGYLEGKKIILVFWEGWSNSAWFSENVPPNIMLVDSRVLKFPLGDPPSRPTGFFCVLFSYIQVFDVLYPILSILCATSAWNQQQMMQKRFVSRLYIPETDQVTLEELECRIWANPNRTRTTFRSQRTPGRPLICLPWYPLSPFYAEHPPRQRTELGFSWFLRNAHSYPQQDSRWW